MKLIVEPTEIPDELYHTVDIRKTEAGDFNVTAKNNETVVKVFVESLALDGDGVGIEQGDIRLGAAGEKMRLAYKEFDEYGYDELQVEFEP